MTREQAIARVREGLASCVVLNAEGEAVEVNGRGIKPLLDMYDQGLLRDAMVIDKLIGRAAAMVLIAGGTKGCHAVTMSRQAFECLVASGIETTFDQSAEYIINRAGNDWCPMEKAVKGIEEPTKAVKAIRDTWRALQQERRE